jgi:hypothetical protein
MLTLGWGRGLSGHPINTANSEMFKPKMTCLILRGPGDDGTDIIQGDRKEVFHSFRVYRNVWDWEWKKLLESRKVKRKSDKIMFSKSELMVPGGLLLIFYRIDMGDTESFPNRDEGFSRIRQYTHPHTSMELITNKRYQKMIFQNISVPMRRRSKNGRRPKH